MVTLEPCAVALKEWDAQVQALLAGRVALVVRKGGIIEARGEFSVEHTRFWLYPTFLHENRGELRPNFHGLLRPNPNPEHIKLEAFATVERVWKVESLEAARTLEHVQSLTADTLERRFKYRDKPWVHALLLRVYRCEPVLLEENAHYAGCVSWVPLEEAVAPQQAQPVLEDAAFSAMKSALEQTFNV